MDRRSFFWGATALACSVPSGSALALPVPPGDAIAFKVFRNGAEIGEHHLNFTTAGDDLRVDINIALLVTIAMIPVYHYKLQAVEKWSGGVFQSLSSMINNNGSQLEVHADKTADGYTVAGVNHSNPAKNYPPYTAPPDTMPLTYWNKQGLFRNILNIQTAHSYRCHVTSPGWNQLPTANGGDILAQRFDITGKLRLSVWYDQQNVWSGLAFSVDGNETYQKIMT